MRGNNYFSLIKSFPQRYTTLVEELINLQPADRKQPLVEAFTALMKDIDCTIINSSAKERFTRNMTTFKNAIKPILAI
jgi:hypothetical protein